MDNSFFERPILNSPYAYPGRHWELDADGQPQIDADFKAKVDREFDAMLARAGGASAAVST